MYLNKLPNLKKRPDVVCDVFIPLRNFEHFFEWYQKVFDFYPLWLVPAKLLNPYPWLTESKRTAFTDEFVIDCAVYGKSNNELAVDYSKLLEDKTDELGGIKTLISRNHFTPEHFWHIFNFENYNQVKQQVDPQGRFPELYTKFCTA